MSNYEQRPLLGAKICSYVCQLRETHEKVLIFHSEQLDNSLRRIFQGEYLIKD